MAKNNILVVSNLLLMMWGATLIVFFFVAAQVTSHEIKVECHKQIRNGPAPESDFSPSFLKELGGELVKVGGNNMMNISWAISVDASLKYLTGTRFINSGSPTYHCQYNPVLTKANLTGSKVWFHYLFNASCGSNFLQAANIPVPQVNSGNPNKWTRIVIPCSKPHTIQHSDVTSDMQIYTTKETVPGVVTSTSIKFAIIGGIAGLMILITCSIIYKYFGANFANSLVFKRLPTAPIAPVPVLVVYPAVNSAFQQAVVTLAEFLQGHGGCGVAVDMWQQGKIAELGPMRWLAEKVMTAQRVLIVCPQTHLRTRASTPNTTLQEPSIPAAAQDLYPLILNMVASHAKSTSGLAQFWVVKLGKQQDKEPGDLPLELRACKTFSLMKDLNKLYRKLHSKSKDNKTISDLIFGPRVAYSEKCTGQLREAVEKLDGQQSSIFREKEPLKSVVAIV
ncbi:uncharacterized protein LOC134865697 isoform X1 [Eleginops maclovinus]|uniref:uncharacterized protein LOC134865697 isoform X1 n=1 Tax=Eleginops maclovinus TaxID=56733 RepID=UPI0030808E48